MIVHMIRAHVQCFLFPFPISVSSFPIPLFSPTQYVPVRVRDTNARWACLAFSLHKKAVKS